MNEITISIKKLSGIMLPEATGSAEANIPAAATLAAEFLQLGYMMDRTLFDAVTRLSTDKLQRFADTAISAMRNIKGADVVYTSFYPNFPEQVMEASDAELFVNAIMHYISMGTWLPNYGKLPREYALEQHVKPQILYLVTEDEYRSVFTTLLSSNDSLSEEDNEIVRYFIRNVSELVYPTTIPYKETMCMVAALLRANNLDIRFLIKTATDVLRIITYMSDGDVSLASNTIFESLPRRDRRYFTSILEAVASEEDIKRHKNKWIRLAHNLHVGDYSKKLHTLMSKPRNNKRLASVIGDIELVIQSGKIPEAIPLLKKRPGVFARMLDRLIRADESQGMCVVEGFLEVVSKVSTRVLVQVLGHFKGRESSTRTVFPKGMTQRVVELPQLPRLTDHTTVDKLMAGIEEALRARFKELPQLGKIWIDPHLIKCPLPTQQRSASRAARTVARGTRLPLQHGGQGTLRFFIYWIGIDIDLSATLHDEDFKMVERVAWTNIRASFYTAYHSGDRTYAPAPEGASEFIDITLSGLLEKGVRYIAMNVLVYDGPTFRNHAACHAGWMFREHPKSNEIYDPKTVVNKLDLTSSTRNTIPVVFDIDAMEAIWCDVCTSDSFINSVESNRSKIETALRSITNLGNKTTLHELAHLHACRGELVEAREEADYVFGLEGDITPFDVNAINSELLA